MIMNALNSVIYLARYLDPADHHPARIRIVGRLFRGELDFEDIQFPVKTIDINKIENQH